MPDLQLDLFKQDGTDLYFTVLNSFPDSEGYELEYKSAKGGFPVEFWKSYSAFANSIGGYIVLGISEKKGGINIEGLDKETINRYKKIFWDSANNSHTVNVNLLDENDLKIVVYKGVNLLAFKIPAATRTQKPVHLSLNPFENTYKRNYEGDYKCTNEEVRRMLADADLKLHHDSRILKGFVIKDIDLDSLKKYRQMFAAAKPDHPWLTLADIEFLEKLGGYRKDRVTKMEGFTVAALLMFGKENSITDPECVPDFFPDYREVLSSDPEVRWTDRIYPDGTWEANLFKFYLKVWPKISSSLPKPFQLKDGVRKDETPAHIALREAFINTLIHADYTAPGNLVIEHKKDVFNFSNPGTLLVSLFQYYKGGISECRNPNLQKMFLMIGSAEKAGSGVNKIMSGWEYALWRRPYLTIYNQPDRVLLELPMFSILPEETIVALRKMFGEEIDSFGKDELTILSTCHIEGEISNSRLQFLIDLHRTDITRILQELCKKGYLLSENKGRWTTYQLNYLYLSQKAELEKTSLSKMENSVNNVDTSINNVKTSVNNVDTSINNVESSVNNVDTSINNVESSVNNVKTSLPNQKRAWTKKDELNNMILSACESEFKTIEEIAKLINRKPKYIMNNIIPDLIKSEKIERLYPNITNHPNQAYKRKE